MGALGDLCEAELRRMDARTKDQKRAAYVDVMYARARLGVLLGLLALYATNPGDAGFVFVVAFMLFK